jgi:hypothetical protein
MNIDLIFFRLESKSSDKCSYLPKMTEALNPTFLVKSLSTKHWRLDPIVVLIPNQLNLKEWIQTLDSRNARVEPIFGCRLYIAYPGGQQLPNAPFLIPYVRKNEEVNHSQGLLLWPVRQGM